MEVIIGTYEEFLVGYSLKKTNDKLVLEQSFTSHVHCGSVRSVAASSKYIASGAVDEVIHLINMKYRIDTGTLVSHSGTITALEFFRSSYLFSASEDGNIAIWNAPKWQQEKILRGHTDAVNSMSLHTSGKLLISVSKDKSMRTWNLIKGRCAYVVNLKNSAQQVLWSPSCSYFAVVFDDRVDIYSISTGGILHSITKGSTENRFNKVAFIDDFHIILTGDFNEIIIYNIESKCEMNRFTAHTKRIKDLVWVQLDTIDQDLIEPKMTANCNQWLVTVSSDGFIKVWAFNHTNLSEDPTLVTEVDTTCRPTCLTVWSPKVNYKQNFTVPELEIPEEEIEICRAKLKEKKSKRKTLKNDQVGESEEDNNDDDKEEIRQMKPTKKVFRKVSKNRLQRSNNKKTSMTFKVQKMKNKQLPTKKTIDKKWR